MNTAQVYLSHLARAAYKIQQREFAHKKLMLELATLHKISTPTIHKRLKILEHAIQETLETENNILNKQQKEDKFHAKLKKDIRNIDSLVENYLNVAKHQKERISQIDKTIEISTKNRKQTLADIERALNKLEKVYSAELKINQHKQKLQHLKSKIRSFKSRS